MNKLTYLPPVQEGILEVEKLMRSQAEGFHPDLKAALDLLLSSGGKRIRPALTLSAGRMLGGDPNTLIPLAAAIELLHTATLVHDDLIDGSLLRRGIPTLNSQWTPGATVLTGDFIFARAAKMAAETKSVPVIQLFAQTLSVIVNGEITQLFNGHCSTDRSSYFSRIYSKTASLFETSATSAAIISKAPENIIEKMKHFGYELGMAFQIIDDILDFTGDQSMIGKPVGSDLRQGIVTLPVIEYCEHHPNDPLIKPIQNHECVQDDHQINQLVEKIHSSSSIRDAHLEACQFIDRGIKELMALPKSLERDALEEIAHYIVDRRI